MKYTIILIFIMFSCKTIFYHEAYYGLYVSKNVYVRSPITDKISYMDFDYLIIGDGYISIGNNIVKVAYVPGKDRIFLVGNSFQIVLEPENVMGKRNIIFQHLTHEGTMTNPPTYKTWKILKQAKRIQDGTIY